MQLIQAFMTEWTEDLEFQMQGSSPRLCPQDL